MALGLPSLGCRFARNNPVEKSGAGELELVRSKDAIIVNDAAGGGPFNNGNGVVEARETVLLTIPVDARHVSEGLTATVTAVDVSKGDCITSVVERSSAGDQLLRVALPPTMSERPTQLLVGPIELTLGAAGCDPDEALELRLDFRIIERDETLEVPVEFELAALDGRVRLEAVVIDDDLAEGDGEQDLDPGETVVLFPALENAGDALLRAVELEVAQAGRVCVETARFRGSTNARLNFGDIVAGAIVSGSVGTLELVVDEDCDMGDSVELTFEVRDASNQMWSLPWSSPIEAVDAGAVDDDDAGSDDRDAGAD